MPLIGAIPPVRGRRGRPRQRPGAVYADRGYDHDKYRSQVRAQGITLVIARRATQHGFGLGVHRWVIEQAIALLHWFRRLRIRWEDPRRHPRSIPQPRLRDHLLAPPGQPLTLLGPLRPSADMAGAGPAERRCPGSITGMGGSGVEGSGRASVQAGVICVPPGPVDDRSSGRRGPAAALVT